VTDREVLEARMKSSSPFAYGMQYAWALVIFATVLMFSCFIPLILPFGFVHFSYKYIVDKYNLVYVCPKLYESDGRLLDSVMQYVIFCIVVCQMVVAGFFFVKMHYIQTGVVLGLMLASVSLYCLYSFRKQNFRKKQIQRIESMVRNRGEVQQLDIEEEKHIGLQTYTGAYLHPVFKEGDE
jgi:hypothetical protein